MLSCPRQCATSSQDSSRKALTKQRSRSMSSCKMTQDIVEQDAHQSLSSESAISVRTSPTDNGSSSSCTVCNVRQEKVTIGTVICDALQPVKYVKSYVGCNTGTIDLVFVTCNYFDACPDVRAWRRRPFGFLVLRRRFFCAWRRLPYAVLECHRPRLSNGLAGLMDNLQAFNQVELTAQVKRGSLRET